MTNGLISAIKTLDPFYPDTTITEKTNRIYCHQFPLQIRAAKAGWIPYCMYIGQTDPSRGWVVVGEFLVRFNDNDYSKCPERPILFQYWDVHPDILDHELRQIMRKYGWYKNLNGSPEMLCNDIVKDYETALFQLGMEVQKLNDFYYNFEKTYGFSPSVENKKAKNRQEDMFRIPQRSAVYDMCETLKNVSKDAKIYVPKDAYGRFCDYLISQGFSNIYTDKDYEYFYGCKELASDKSELIEFILEEEFFNMKDTFDVIIGNYPYGNAGQLAIDFLIKSSYCIKQDGLILQILPNSVRKTVSQNKIIKGNPYLHCVKDNDCEVGTFPVGIHASVQEWRLGDKPRKKMEVITNHPDFEFLDHEQVTKGANRVDLVIIRSGNAGRMIRSQFEKYLPKKGDMLDHFFIQVRDDNVLDKLLTLEKELVEIGKNTNGRNHVSKGEIVEVYQKQTQSAGGFFG